MSKRLIILKGTKVHPKNINIDGFDRIIFISDLKYEMQTNLDTKVKTISQYEEELQFSLTGFEEAHNLIEEWKRIPVNSFKNKELAEVLKYESVSILDTLHSDLQIYYLSWIVRSIELVKKIIETSGKKLVINYDETKPTIKSKLAVDTSKAGELFGWSPKVSFEDGIKSTIQWYMENSK